ncbi:MAG: hypothetical protein RLZZ308_270 [Candidatus Parcubacteria bacterium]|jgi:hypothetical protein
MSPKLLNILLVLLPAVLYFGYIDPMYTGDPGLVWTPEKNIRGMQSLNVQYANTLNQVTAIERGAVKLSRDFEGVKEEDKLKMSIMMPDTIDQVKLRNEVITIAANSGVAIDGLKVEKDLKGEKGLNAYNVSFSMRTQYPTFKTFVENYERSMRFFNIEQLAIQRPEQDDSSAQKAIIEDTESLNITMSSKVYYMK